METDFSDLQILRDLGLTSLQARVYLALLESEPLRVSVISKISNIARPDVYRTLSKLEKAGLVEKIIRKPVEYRAIPLKKGLSLLLETKTQHYEKVRAGTRMLLDRATTKKSNKKNQRKGNPQFVLIPKGKTVIEKIRTAIEKAKVSVDLVLSWKRFSQGIAGVFGESMEIALANEVKIRFVIENHPEGKTAEQLIHFCGEKLFCEVRFIPQYPEAVFGIYDGKEIFIVTKSKTDLPGSPALWSNNPNLIGLAKDYFEMLWRTATKESKLETQHTRHAFPQTVQKTENSID